MAVHGPAKGPGQNPAYRPPDASSLRLARCAPKGNKPREPPTLSCDSEERRMDIRPIDNGHP